MAEQIETTEASEEKTTVTSTASKKETKKSTRTKMLKSEKITVSLGKKITVVFPGTSVTQREVYDAATMPNGARSLVMLYQNFMNQIIDSPKIDWDYFDKKIAKEDRESEVVITEDDGTEVTYKLTFPGVQELLAIRDAATSSFGEVLDGPLFQGFIMDIIQSEDITDLDYFDSHNGYRTLMDTASNLMDSWLNDSEIYSYMNGVDAFIQRMFR